MPTGVLRNTGSFVGASKYTPMDCRILLPGARVSRDAIVAGGSVIGDGSVVEAFATVDGSVVFDGATIGVGASIVGSIVGAGATIGAQTRLRGAVVGDGAVIGAENEFLDGARVWSEAHIADCTVRYSSDQE